MATITDIDGNKYSTVIIGEQEWLVENLKTTRYNNGELIGTTIPATKDYSNEIEPKYQWAYNGDEKYVGLFGRLYTWYAATDKRKITPEGWRIASENDWNKLKEYLNSKGYNAKAIAAKSCWNLSDSKSPVIGNNFTDNNKLFFLAFPGGYRIDKEYTNGNKPNPMFREMGTHGYWWSSNELDKYDVMNRSLYHHGDRINDFMCGKQFGLSIRCVRDV